MTLTLGQHETEVRGISQLLAENFIELFVLDCQADFGDARCKYDASTVTDSATVTSIGTAQRVFAATIAIGTPRPAGFYSFGLITWTSGRNKGVSTEIKTWDGTNFTLYLPSAYPISVGDAFTAVAGCDKSFVTCLNKFQNTVNFRGFPYIPGLDSTLYPNAAAAAPTSA